MTSYRVIWVRNQTWKTRLTMTEKGTEIDLGGVTEIEMGVAGMTGDPLMNGTGIAGEIGIEIETVRGVEIDETVREARTDPPMMTGTLTVVTASTALTQGKTEPEKSG